MTIVNIASKRARRPDYGFGVDADELRRFFREYESCAGFKSTFGPMLAVACGAIGSGGPPAKVDYLAERVDTMRPLTRTYRRLRHMDDTGFRKEVVVLAKLHGFQHPSLHRQEFEDLSPIVDMTTAALDARDDLVATDGERRADLAGLSIDRIRPDCRRELERDFWREAGKIERLTKAHNRIVDRLDRAQEKLASGEGLSKRALTLLDSGNARLSSYALRINASVELQGKILDAFLSNGRVAARIGAMMSADRATSTWDAIRWKLDKPPGLHGDALAAWNADRTSFILQARREAEELRRSAHTAYRKARAEVSNGS